MANCAGSEPCRACGALRSRIFHRAKRVPVHCCQLIESREDALVAPTGELELSFCEACGFIQNDAFDPARIDYRESYEDSQAFSKRFQEFARELADRLIETYDLRGRDVLEIGCGKGDFLKLLCERGGNRGVGIDPSWQGGRQDQPLEGAASLEFLADYYTEKDRERRFDLLLCRHTLEHLPRVADFIALVRDGMALSPDSVALFEVPDVLRVLEERAFWDLYYEHCSYFSMGSLARSFASAGFEVLRLAREYEEQYVVLDARPLGTSRVIDSAEEQPDLERLDAAVRSFERGVRRQVESWRDRLLELHAAGRTAVLWGAGSKAVGFLSTMGLGPEVSCVVDINPHKQGMYLPGSGHPVRAPAHLATEAPDLVVVMNAIYETEIREDLEGMGISPEVVSL